MDAGRILREARRRAGLTQAELAERAGVFQPTVARIESRKRVPRVDTLDRLLEACGAQLILTRRLGVGVGREPIRRLLPLAPEHRLGNRLSRLVGLLAWRRVDFILIGSAAERLHASPAPVDELLVCVARGSRNRKRMAGVRTTVQGYRVQLGTLRLRTIPPPPFRSYAELNAGAVETRVGKWTVSVASLDDLIRMRLVGRSRASNAAAEILGALREETDRLAAGNR